MKLTPLDIHHKEFGHALRGYNEEQVDRFLDEVADEFERLFKENIDQSERLDQAAARIAEFEAQRHTINNTMVAAQRSADDIIAKTQAEAASVLREAELKAKEIIHNALSKKQVVANELIRIKQAEEVFRAQFRTLLENNLRGVSEITLPDDVDVLLGETDEGVVGDVMVRPQPEPSMPIVAPAAPAPAPVMPAAAPPQPAPAVAPSEPPAPGFVKSVAIGEVGEPDLPEDLTFVEPTEFPMSSFAQLGEREDDIDIEEID